MTDWIDAQGFRANVGIVLIRDGGEVFLGGRSDGRGWQFPQGGVQPDESAIGPAQRPRLSAIGSAAAAAASTPRRTEAISSRAGSIIASREESRGYSSRSAGNGTKERADATNAFDFPAA